MSPPNNVISYLKDARKAQWWALVASGYLYPAAPITKEQAAHICLAFAIDQARVVAQLIEDDLYDEVFEVFAESKTPKPW